MGKRAHFLLLVLMTLALAFGPVSFSQAADPATPAASAEKAAPAADVKKEEVKAEASKPAPAKAETKKADAKAGPKDPAKAYWTLGILLAAAILFFTEALPLAVTAMLVPCALNLLGILNVNQAFANFGETNVVLFMAMFILGDATFITGFANKVGAATVKMAKGSELRLMVLAMIFVGVLSGFLSNTGTTAMAIPMLMGMCAAAKLSPGRILMPVAFAASMGGCLSLVGTPPNLLINAALQQMGGPVGVKPFGFFEFAIFGAPLLVLGIVYFATIGRRFLPASKAEEGESFENDESKRKMRPEKMGICVTIFGAVVICMAGNLIPLTTACMLGAMLMVITRCITMKEAYNAIDWETIFLFAGMLSMSTAMQASGAATMLANAVVSMVSDPYALLAACSILSMLLTNFMSNTATAALMAPLAIPIAIQGGVSPLPLAMAIAMSCSACFLTPVATPPNTLVLGPGKYSFNDYWRSGGLLQVLTFVLVMVIIPIAWPF